MKLLSLLNGLLCLSLTPLPIGSAVQERCDVPHAPGGPSDDHRGVLPVASPPFLLRGHQAPDDGDVGSCSTTRCSPIPQGHEGVAEGRSFKLSWEAQ